MTALSAAKAIPRLFITTTSHVMLMLRSGLGQLVSCLIFFGQHDRDDSFGHRRIGWIRGMISEAPIEIIDFEKDRFPFGFERSEVMFFVRIVGMAEIVV